MANCEYLIGVGAAKAGTTLLYSLLCKHPELRLGKAKELHYFDRTDNPSKTEYDALFSGDGVSFDVTPSYMYLDNCLEKIAATLGSGNVKIVVLLRNPIERALSHYNMHIYQGQEKLGFEEAFRREKERIAIDARHKKLYGYFSRGLYSIQLKNIFKSFPKENTLVLLFEDFIANQQRHVDAICDFAGIGRISVAQKHSNIGISAIRFKWLDVLVKKLSINAPRALRIKPLRELKHYIKMTLGKPIDKRPINGPFAEELRRYYEKDVESLKTDYGVDVSKWQNFNNN